MLTLQRFLPPQEKNNMVVNLGTTAGQQYCSIPSTR